MTLNYNVHYKMASVGGSHQMGVVVHIASRTGIMGINYTTCALDHVKGVAICALELSVREVRGIACDALTDPGLTEFVRRLQRFQFTGEEQGFFADSSYGAVLCRVGPADKFNSSVPAMTHEFDLAVFRAFWNIWIFGDRPSKHVKHILACALRKETLDVIEQEKLKVTIQKVKHVTLVGYDLDLHGIVPYTN